MVESRSGSTIRSIAEVWPIATPPRRATLGRYRGRVRKPGVPSGVLHLKGGQGVRDLNGEDRKGQWHREFSSAESSEPPGRNASISRGQIRLRVSGIAVLKWDSIASAASKAWAVVIKAAASAVLTEAVGVAVTADSRIKPAKWILTDGGISHDIIYS